jgi:hypothetical protein
MELPASKGEVFEVVVEVPSLREAKLADELLVLPTEVPKVEVIVDGTEQVQGREVETGV